MKTSTGHVRRREVVCQSSKAALIPSAKFKPVSGSGHLMPIDAPEGVIAGIDGFLNAMTFTNCQGHKPLA